MDINVFIEKYQQRSIRCMDRYFKEQVNNKLLAAMSYSINAGGKRLRPLLVYAAGQIHNLADEKLDATAAAVEMIHTYSLIHDDLPAMDNDDLRRGKPSCHIAYDEATAILAGDALQCLAFEIISSNDNLLPAATKIKLIHTLSNAIGYEGMAGGQNLDLAATGKSLSLEALNHIHYLKTGALIQACILMGASISEQFDTNTHDSLKEFGYWLGLGFQIRDDLLDITATSEQLGKPQGSDHLNNKTTYPTLLGIDGAECEAYTCFDKALTQLGKVPGNTEILRQLSRFLIIREM